MAERMIGMKKINKIKVERFYNIQTKEKEINEIIISIDEIDKELSILSKNVYPYGFAVKMSEIVDSARRWRKNTSSSRQVIIAELNGCIDIINDEISLHNEKDVEVRIIYGKNAGKIEIMKESVAKDFIKMGFAILI